MPLTAPLDSTASPARGFRASALAVVLAAQIAVFSLVSTNFLSTENFLEIGRLTVEIGLLALALTPVIMTGGIDLSVGSLLGLAAVVLGKLWRDAGWSIWLAAFAAVFTGVAGGALNALFIARLRIPALIVTLGTYSLYRGIAEGITGGVDTFTGLPASFLFLAQGYWWGVAPAQLPILIVAATGFWILVHRSTAGRAWGAIGYSYEGARHAGLEVSWLVAACYLLAGLCAGLSAVVYVSHVGQAKADAGTNYELAAITAVVLGGTSIFGGYATIGGTLLGLFAIAVLQNGMRLADQPAEAAGALTALLLLVSVGNEARCQRPTARRAADCSIPIPGEFEMRNTQLAALCAVILAAGALIALSNWHLAKSVKSVVSVPREAAQSGGPAPQPARRLTIAMMPKSKGNAYFIACRKGAEEAAAELGVNLIWDGPTETDPAKQSEVVETWITRQVDVIAVAVENRTGLAGALRRARERGITVVTWDADTEPDARELFINQATPQGIGQALMDEAARVLGGQGAFAVITASLTAANQNEWRKHIEARLAEKYPQMTLATVRPCDDQQKKAFEAAQTIMNAHPEVRLLMAICSPAVPGAAEAVKQSGRDDVKVIGLGLPNDNRRFVHEGITEAVILWNTMDLGYLTIHAACALREGRLHAGDARFTAGRLGAVQLEGDNVLLGQPFRFDRTNIDQFDF